MINGLFETHILVKDLVAAADFYENVLGLEFAHYEERRRANFYWIGGKETGMLGVWEVKDRPIERRHFAFRTTVEDFKRTIPFLKSKGVTPRNFNDTGEDPLVICWMPAVSIYFSDPDGHSLEFLATLPDEPKPELNLVPWTEWEIMHGRKL